MALAKTATKYFLFVIIIAFCNPAYGAEFIIYNTDHWMDALSVEQVKEYVKKYPNFQAKYDARYQRGDVIEVRPDGYWTGPKAPGYDKKVFLVVTKPGLSFVDAKHYGMALRDSSRNIVKRRKYNFSNVRDKQVINDFSEITVTEKRILSAKETTTYISPFMYLLNLLFG